MTYTVYNVKNEEDTISPTFCPVPWHHQYFDTDGSEGLCYNSPVFTHGELEWNGSQMKKIRLDMLAGRKNRACSVCHNEEKSGKCLSLRQQILNWDKIKHGQDMEWFKSHVKNVTREDGYITRASNTLHIALGNTCTGQCIMCSPWNSSALRPIHKHINSKLNFKELDVREFQWTKNDDLWKKKFYPLVEQSHWINLMGGEPFLTKRQHDILQYCVDKDIAKDKTIYYNTNCAQSVPDKTLELWKHFKHIHLDLSIDDMNERVEYIRYPVKWDQFIKFLNWCDNNTNDNVTIEVLPSIANYNIYYYPDFVNWMVKQKFKKVNKNLGGLPGTNIVHFPERVGIKTLPEKMKRIIIDKYKYWQWETNGCDSNIQQVRDNYEWCLTRIKQLPKLLENSEYLGDLNGQDHYDTFKRWHSELDKMRGTSFYNTFPIFKEHD